MQAAELLVPQVGLKKWAEGRAQLLNHYNSEMLSLKCLRPLSAFVIRFQLCRIDDLPAVLLLPRWRVSQSWDKDIAGSTTLILGKALEIEYVAARAGNRLQVDEHAFGQFLDHCGSAQTNDTNEALPEYMH